MIKRPIRIANLKLLTLLFVSLITVTSQAQSLRSQLIDSSYAASDRLKFTRALSFREEALAISRKSGKTSLIVADLLALGQIQMGLNDMDKAFGNYIEALPLSESLPNDSLEFEALRKISFYFMEFEDLDRSEEYLKRAKKIASSNKPTWYYQQYYLCLGILERRKNNFDASIQAYKKSLELTPHSAKIEKIRLLNNLASAYAKAGKIKLAIAQLLEAESINNDVQNDWFRLVIPGQLGQLNAMSGNYQKAIDLFSLTLEMAKKTDHPEMVRRSYSSLAQIHYKIGNYKKAYDYNTEFILELKNSNDRENASAIAEMAAKYEHEKKEQKIATLEQEKKLKDKIHQSQTERKNLWLALAIIVAALTIIIAVVVFKNQRNKQRLKLELAEKQKELAKQESELKGQELERNRLSRELHDGLGGTLSSIKMRLSSKNIEEIQPILTDIDAACQDVRNMSHSLSSAFINEIDFYSLLNKLAEDIRVRSGLYVNLEFMPLEELNKLETERKHQCYRIIQELTNNTVKHAQASTLTIGLIKNENDVLLLIEDDGVGFDTTLTSEGIGLDNVKKRLEKIGGIIDIRSSKTEGSSFSINFPFIEIYDN